MVIVYLKYGYFNFYNCIIRKTYDNLLIFLCNRYGILERRIILIFIYDAYFKRSIEYLMSQFFFINKLIDVYQMIKYSYFIQISNVLFLLVHLF